MYFFAHLALEELTEYSAKLKTESATPSFEGIHHEKNAFRYLAGMHRRY